MNPTKETLEAAKAAKVLTAEDFKKAGIYIAQDLVAYDLEDAAKLLFPVITPLRNTIPRVGGGIGTAVHWKSVVGINTANLSPGVAEGMRGGALSIATADCLAAYQTLGFEMPTSFEAEEASLPGTDNKALAALLLLESLMIAEEITLLGGNYSLDLAQPVLAALVDKGAGSGSLGTGVVLDVYCVPLTLDGFRNASLAGIPLTVQRPNADGTTSTYGGGSGPVSAQAQITLGSGAGHAVQAALTAPVQGAVAYAWYWGPDGGSIKLGAITTIDSVLITALAAGTQTYATVAAAGDNSQNSLVYDGLLSIICQSAPQVSSVQGSAPGLGGYVAFQPTGTPGVGTPLTADGAGGIVEINQALEAFWNNYRLSPDIMYVHAQELINITNKVIAGGGTPLFRFNVDAKADGLADVTLTAGAVIGTYLNKFTMSGGQLVKVMLHPNMPPGTILFRCTRLPYPLANVPNIIQVKTRREYYEIDWPLRTRQYERGAYYSGVLQCYFAPAFGAIFNIGNG